MTGLSSLMNAGAGSLLEVRDLRTHIRMRRATVEAVDGLSMTIKAGETVGLVGESGCGKSMTGLTMIRVLNIVVFLLFV